VKNVLLPTWFVELFIITRSSDADPLCCLQGMALRGRSDHARLWV
jgi:hypothetical protein